MTLTGNLEAFPLEEVLRMLARSRKSGCLRIDTVELQGRVFIAAGGLTFASTLSDDEFRRHILSSGLVEEPRFRKVELSGASLVDVLVDGASPSSLSDYVREHVVESLFRIRRKGRGTFDFALDVAPRYPTAQSFDVDVMLAEADRRALEWEEIEAVVPDGSIAMRMISELTDDEPVTLNAPTWKLLAALGSGASAVDLADRLGMTEFRASRDLSGLVRNGLVEETPATAAHLPEPAPAPVAIEGPVEVPEAPAVIETPPADNEPVPAATAVQDDAWFTPAEPEHSQIAEPPAAVSQVEELPAEVSQVAEPPADEPSVEEPQIEEAPPVVSWPATGETTEPDSSTSDVSAPSSWNLGPGETPVAAEPPAAAEDGVSPWERSAWTVEASQPEAPAPAPEQPAAHQSGWPGWGDAAVGEPEPEPGRPAVEAEAPAREQPAGEAGAGWWSQTMGDSQRDADEGQDSDADKFLESVFSSLSDDETGSDDGADDETGFGLGLLRRRRMGAAARDIPENDH
jgi:hypothetical protein